MTFDPATFFDASRHGVMGPELVQGEVDGANAILAAMEGLPRSFCAYALGTGWHETAHSMEPVREANWLSDDAANRYFFRMYDIQGQRPNVARGLGNLQPGDGVKFCGRGYPQVTGRTNYEWASALTGVDLITHPERMMEPAIAAMVMRAGMEHGKFTGRKFADYLPTVGDATRAQFIQARWIINRQDKADVIADYSLQFQSALGKAGWA